MKASVPGAQAVGLEIRPAVEGDFGRIAEIYAFEVLHRTATFELEPPDAAEMRRRKNTVTDRGLPYVVATVENDVAGFAYAGPFRMRPAYDFTVEDSIYLDPRWHRRGIGRALLRRLIEDATSAGCRQMVAMIGDSANVGSIGLHVALGFREVGRLKAVGWKFGRWLDVVMMQLALGAGAKSVPGAAGGGAPPAI